MAFCMNCVKEFSDEEEYCPYCGVKKERSAWPAAPHIQLIISGAHGKIEDLLQSINPSRCGDM